MNFQNGRALIIGISDYAGVTPLPEAVLHDARDFASLLKSNEHCGYPAANIRVLLNEEATLSAIRAALAELAAAAGTDDTITIFFSGHGTRLGDGETATSALVPFDARFDDLATTTLPEHELSAALSKIKARRLVLLIDACHAGDAGSFKSVNNAFHSGFDEKSLQRLASGTGRVILASSRGSETSLILPGARNSVFSDAVLTALRGKARTVGDGLVRVFDLFNYVAEHVAHSVPGRQHPIFKASDLEENFPMALEHGGAKLKHADIAGPTSWRQLEQLLADLYPGGPTDQDIWARAGGDVSRLKLTGTGRANWFSALRTLKLGGGGQHIHRAALIQSALDDYPHHVELISLLNRQAT